MGGHASWLFVPGASERFMAKLVEVRPDAAVLDLEDGISRGELAAARARVAAATASGGPVPLAVRTHPVSSEEFAADLEACGPGLAALVIPKVSAPEEVAAAGEALVARGLKGTRLVPMIESAAGLMRAHDILTAHASVSGVALGAEDLAADLGLPPALPGSSAALLEGRRAALAAARAALVAAASAARVAIRVDSPYLSLLDVPGTKAEALAGRGAGFTGKFALHPAQVPAIAEAFRPGPEEVEWARAVLAKAGRGVQRAGDRMVDEAVVRQARVVLSDEGS